MAASAQGIGQAMLERCVYDDESGQLLSGSFMDYAMPRAVDLPDFTVETAKGTPCTHNPLGVKGCGEAGAIGAPPAVISAVRRRAGAARRDAICRCRPPRIACGPGAQARADGHATGFRPEPDPRSTARTRHVHIPLSNRPADADAAVPRCSRANADAKLPRGRPEPLAAMKRAARPPVGAHRRDAHRGGSKDITRRGRRTVTIGAKRAMRDVRQRSREVRRRNAGAGGAGRRHSATGRCALGTIGGSLANDDPAACYPAAVLALNATVVTDRRIIAADNFFQGMYETALEPDEPDHGGAPLPDRAAATRSSAIRPRTSRWWACSSRRVDVACASP